jgi:hypothetical protein
MAIRHAREAERMKKQVAEVDGGLVPASSRVYLIQGSVEELLPSCRLLISVMMLVSRGEAFASVGGGVKGGPLVKLWGGVCER